MYVVPLVVSLWRVLEKELGLPSLHCTKAGADRVLLYGKVVQDAKVTEIEARTSSHTKYTNTKDRSDHKANHKTVTCPRPARSNPSQTKNQTPNTKRKTALISGQLASPARAPSLPSLSGLDSPPPHPPALQDPQH